MQVLRSIPEDGTFDKLRPLDLLRGEREELSFEFSHHFRVFLLC